MRNKPRNIPFFNSHSFNFQTIPPQNSSSMFTVEIEHENNMAAYNHSAFIWLHASIDHLVLVVATCFHGWLPKFVLGWLTWFDIPGNQTWRGFTYGNFSKMRSRRGRFCCVSATCSRAFNCKHRVKMLSLYYTMRSVCVLVTSNVPKREKKTQSARIFT